MFRLYPPSRVSRSTAASETAVAELASAEPVLIVAVALTVPIFRH